MSRFLLAAALASAAGAAAHADEGMWTFNRFPRDKVKQAYGFAPDDAWLEHARLASVRLAGGCSASFVSPDGLVMTNHHCVRECLLAKSTDKRDLERIGFYARTEADEMACPDVELNQLSSITEVTKRINAATRGLADKEWGKAQRAEMSRIEKECAAGDPKVRCDVVSLYHGGRYDLYRYRRWTEARLVFSPESDAASFGGDPDNFNFPRYDLDVAFLRAYEDGKPARTPHHFSWSQAGAREGELVFVSGHPGSTQRLLTVAQLEYLRDVELPHRLKTWAELRGVLTVFGRRSPEAKRVSQALLYSVENSYKRGNGQHAALLDKAFFRRKVDAETALRAKIAKDPRKQKLYGGAWDAIARARAELRKLRLPHLLIERGEGFHSTLFGFARDIVRWSDEKGKPSDERLREYRDSALTSLVQRTFSPAPIHADLEEVTLAFSLGKLRELLGADHPLCRKVLGREAPEELAARLVRGTKLGDVNLRRKLWEGGPGPAAGSDDPMIKLAIAIDADARDLRKRFEDEIEAPEKKNAELIARAVFDAQGESSYPDATFTLRLSYGAARGYQADAGQIPMFTKIGGAFERATGSPPFALPGSWYFAESRLDKDVPLDFVYDCDTVGGNSGSPIVNQRAEIVGVNFDSNLYALGRAFQYEPALGRSIAVSSAGIREALLTIYSAQRLVAELK